MAESWLRSYAIDAPDPVPWGWNPAATFQTAFNDAQEEKRAQEEFEMGKALEEILLPQKKAQVEFNLKKLAYESENLTNAYKLESEITDAKRRMLRSGGQGGGSNNAPATNAQGFQSKFGWGSKIATPPQAASRPKPTWQVVAPAQPNPTGP
jgi:hypothetical protein